MLKQLREAKPILYCILAEVLFIGSLFLSKKSRHAFVCMLFCLSEPGFEQGGGMKCRKQSHSMALFSPRVPTSRKVYPGRSRNTFVYWSFFVFTAGQ